MFLIIMFPAPSPAADGVAGKFGSQPTPTSGLSPSDHYLLKQRVMAIRSTADYLEKQLDAIGKLPPSSCIQAWQSVHNSVAQLQTRSSEFQQQTSALRQRKLGRADWADLNQSNGGDLVAAQEKLESIRRKYAALREDLKSKRDYVEAKYKEEEQRANSDYQILISIIKAINEELLIFNKSMN